LRHLLASYLERVQESEKLLTQTGSVARFAPGVHQKEDMTREDLSVVRVNGQGYRFYKSHIPNHSRLQPEKIIYISRHPLDIFLSCLNYMYLEKRASFFLNGIAKSAAEIASNAEMDFYFSRFLTDMGASFYEELLAANSRIDNHVKILDHKDVILIKYETLLEQREDYFYEVLERLFGKTERSDLSGLFDLVDGRTKNSGDPFFWQSKSGTRFDFLSESQIRGFEEANQDLLKKLGYL